jgi:hypothetical protein
LRQLLRNRTRLGNGALLIMLALLLNLTFAIGPATMASAATPQISGTVTALSQVTSGKTTVEIQTEPTTETFQNPWVSVWLNGALSQTVEGMAYLVNSVYGVAYNVYATVYNLPSVTTANLVYKEVYGQIVSGAVYFNVYLNVPTAPPPCTSCVVPTPPPSPSHNVTSSSGQTVGYISTSVGTVDGIEAPVVQVVLNTQEVLKTLSTLSASEKTLSLSVPNVSFGTGQVVQVPLSSSVVHALIQDGKSLQVSTGIGSIVISPALLEQADGQLPSGDSLTVQIRQTPASETTTINQNESLRQADKYLSASPAVNLSLEEVTSQGQVAGTIEPKGDSRVGITLPFNSSVSGAQALTLGVYRWSPSRKAWLYIGGKVDLATGTVTSNVPHLSTYEVLADTQTFTDIQGNYAQTDIQILLAHHVINGMTPTLFEPNLSVTRAQFVTMIVRALGLPLGTSSNTGYKDVSASDWFAGAVESATAAGIVNGYPGDEFMPNAPISRQQMAAMVVRAMSAAHQAPTIVASQVSGILAPYTDANQVASWAKTAMAVAIEQHIIDGMTSSTLVPDGTATRAQAAVVIKRLLVYLGAI